MGTKSVETREFRCRLIADDASSFYTALRHVNGTVDTITNERLRSMFAEYIKKNEQLKNELSEYCTDVDKYCRSIEKGEVPVNKTQIEAAARRCKLVIYILSITNKDQNRMHVNPKIYGVQGQPPKECVYIQYDEQSKHYDPLYVMDKKNPEEKTTLFVYNDSAVHELLVQFFCGKLPAAALTQHHTENSIEEMELPTQSNDISPGEDPWSAIAESADTTASKKRELPDYAKLLLGTVEQEFCPPNKKQKTPACIQVTSNEPSEFIKDVSQSPTVEQHLQTNFFWNEIEVAMSVDVPTTSGEAALTWSMRFANEPAPRFRGRTDSEFKPKKEVNETGSSRWFRDQENNPFITLLILEEYLQPNTDYGIEIRLVTSEINGYTYDHPYFKLQVHPSDRTISNVNPLLKRFSENELTQHSDGIKQLQLKMVVVMHTNPELMQADQPLRVFSSENGGTPITQIYERQSSFKEAYHLHDLRFVGTLMTRTVGENEFQRHDDIQCISQITTEDKNFLKRT